MKQYLTLLEDVLNNGLQRDDRTGIGTISKFGTQMRFNLQDGFPILTTKKIHFKSVFYELNWILSGNTNTKYLKDNGITIWDEWASEDGSLGPIYGKQLRDFNGVDQLNKAIELIKKDPNSRRNVITLWNPSDLDKQALHCCHGTVIQFYVSSNRLSCSMYQRSGDVFLGIPFNISSYSLLTHMVAQVCDLEVGEFIHTIGDTHLYLNHIDQAKIQLLRTPTDLPKIELNKEIRNINNFKYQDIKLIGYNPQPNIKAQVAI